MATLDDVRSAIEKNLSAEVGDILRKRLAQADIDAAACVTFREKVVGLEKQINELYLRVKSAEEVETLIKQNREVEAKALAATAFKQIVDLKMKHAEERVSDMKSLVSMVFQNNQYKYTLTDSGNTPIPTGQGSYYPANHNRVITGQGEGAPPPPPASGP